jgi:hypothetical protein
VLHLASGEAFGIKDNSKRVAPVRPFRKDINLVEGARPDGFDSHRCMLAALLAWHWGVCETTSMTENKTMPTGVPVEEFLASVEHPGRRTDGYELLALMREATGQEPVMWGPSIVGFGRYHYRYGSGREGDSAAVGFSPRKASLALYGLTYGPEAKALLETLGKHKTGAACLYINRLDDVDRDILTLLVRSGYRHVMAELHSP